MIQNEWRERRKVQRVDVDFHHEWWLGSIYEVGGYFEYRLLDTSPLGMGIEIRQEFHGMMNLTAYSELPRPKHPLEANTYVHLHLPFRWAGEFRDLGRITRLPTDGEMPQKWGIELVGKVPLHYPVFLEFYEGDFVIKATKNSLQALFVSLLRDSYFLKRGIAIYFNHLIPCFSRAALSRKRLSNAESREVFHTTHSSLEESVRILQEFLVLLENQPFDIHKLNWDWKRLRYGITSDFQIEDLVARYRTREVRPYLRSIRLLDHRLYVNFNTLLALQHLVQENYGCYLDAEETESR